MLQQKTKAAVFMESSCFFFFVKCGGFIISTTNPAGGLQRGERERPVVIQY